MKRMQKRDGIVGAGLACLCAISICVAAAASAQETGRQTGGYDPALPAAVPIGQEGGSESDVLTDPSLFGPARARALEEARRAGQGGNHATIVQGGGDNQAVIRQDGESNEAETTQEGLSNDLLVIQNGDDNEARESQSGAYNHTLRIQNGRKTEKWRIEQVSPVTPAR